MDQIAVVGHCWRQGQPETIERFSRPRTERNDVLRELAQALDVREVVFLATCNRVEVAFAVEDSERPGDRRRAIFRVLTGDEPAPGEAERCLRAWTGEGAVERILLVAAGLESAQIGETEIAGQMRDAVEFSRAEGFAGPRLTKLFESALRISRKVRGGTGLGEGRTSLAEIALDPVRDALEKSGAPVALLGVSSMTERCGLSLAEIGAPILVVNRTLARAEELCRKLGATSHARSLADFLSAPEAVSAVVSATGSPEPILRKPELSRLAKVCTGGPKPQLIDFAIPPDIDPIAAKELDFERMGMEQITARAAKCRANRTVEAAEARELIDQALTRLRGQMGRARLNAAVSTLQQNYQAAAQTSLEKLLRHELPELCEGDRDILRRWTETLARRFAHLPSHGLRELAESEGASIVQSFFAGADNEFLVQLERTLANEIEATR